MGTLIKNGIDYTGGSGASSYNALSDKPSINSVTLVGNKTADDLGLITKAVNDLTNYYNKTASYSKAEVDSLIAAAKNGRFVAVATLPTTDIQTNVIYLVPSSDPETGNVKDEYINLDGTTAGWEKIGNTDIELALTALSDVNITSPTNNQVLKYNSTSGKWENGTGGSGGGHTIEDSEGTELTQRDTLQFGEGFVVEDDDTNEKTVVSPNVMQSSDMSDVIHGLPAVTDKAYLKYSTDEQVIGEWIDHKPLYQKTFVNTMPTQPTSGSFNYKYIDIGASVDYAEIVSACVLDSAVFMPFLYLTNDLSKYAMATINNNNHSTSPNKLGINCNNWYGLPCYITIRYTKTTDTPNT